MTNSQTLFNDVFKNEPLSFLSNFFKSLCLTDEAPLHSFPVKRPNYFLPDVSFSEKDEWELREFLGLGMRGEFFLKDCGSFYLVLASNNEDFDYYDLFYISVDRESGYSYPWFTKKDVVLIEKRFFSNLSGCKLTPMSLSIKLHDSVEKSIIRYMREFSFTYEHNSLINPLLFLYYFYYASSEYDICYSPVEDENFDVFFFNEKYFSITNLNRCTCQYDSDLYFFDSDIKTLEKEKKKIFIFKNINRFLPVTLLNGSKKHNVVKRKYYKNAYVSPDDVSNLKNIILFDGDN